MKARLKTPFKIFFLRFWLWNILLSAGLVAAAAYAGVSLFENYNARSPRSLELIGACVCVTLLQGLTLLVVLIIKLVKRSWLQAILLLLHLAGQFFLLYGLWMLFIVAIGFTGTGDNQSKEIHDISFHSAADVKEKFPPHFYYQHPYGVEDMPQSLYITDTAFLDSPEYERLSFPANYTSFFNDPGKAIGELAGSSKSKPFSKWLKTLPGKKVILESHQSNDPPHCIQFTEFKHFDDWKEHWPSFGITVALHDAKKDLSHLPEPLKEIYRFGRIHLYSFFCSGGFLDPAEIKPIAKMKNEDGEYLRECAGHYQERSDAHLDLDSLRPFYDDSGCFLLVDQKENIWVGGVECGDLYGTPYKLQEVLDRLFELLQSQPVVHIGEIVSEKQWKEKN